jgi:hypothetical protein
MDTSFTQLWGGGVVSGVVVCVGHGEQLSWCTQLV